jgi:hypothetical protein
VQVVSGISSAPFLSNTSFFTYATTAFSELYDEKFCKGVLAVSRDVQLETALHGTVPVETVLGSSSVRSSKT